MKYKYELLESEGIELEIPENEIELHDRNKLYINSLYDEMFDKYSGTYCDSTIMHMVNIQLGIELQRLKYAAENHNVIRQSQEGNIKKLLHDIKKNDYFCKVTHY